MRAHPLDLVGVDVWRGVFDGCGEVEDDFIRDGRLPEYPSRPRQISRENSNSVLVKLSGEYSKRIFVPAAVSGCEYCFTHDVPRVAIAMISARDALKTCFRCAGEVEL